MFFIYKHSERVELQPKDFTQDALAKVESELRRKVEGHVLPEVGLVLTVLDIMSKSVGRIHFETASAMFDIEYTALCMKPQNNEVIRAVVDTIEETMILAKVGPMNVFIVASEIPSDFRFNSAGDPHFYNVNDPSDTIRLQQEINVRVMSSQLKNINTMVH